VSSTDIDELAALCHRVVIFQRGRLVACLSGAEVTQGSIAHACVAETYQERL
jgi:ribose transport system ATP-binding protein